jgi:hypothetical protein
VNLRALQGAALHVAGPAKNFVTRTAQTRKHPVGLGGLGQLEMDQLDDGFALPIGLSANGRVASDGAAG